MLCQTYLPKCQVQIGECILFADLIVLPMHDFDVILGMDWLARYRVVMDCFEKTVRLAIDGSDDTVEFVGEKRPPSTRVITCYLVSLDYFTFLILKCLLLLHSLDYVSLSLL